MSRSESTYVENKAYLARCARDWPLGKGEPSPRKRSEAAPESDRLPGIKAGYSSYIPFLTEECGVQFRGRILEINAGSAWLSAELSKLPRVVAVIATDPSPRVLKERAPRAFKQLHAHTDKITRTPCDPHHLDFANNHFDYVVCSGVLHRAANIVQVLREAKRVLKPGGQLVAVREPVWPLLKIKSRSKMLAKLLATGVDDHFYTLSDYKEFFKQAALPLDVKRVNVSRGFKYYVNKFVNGLTHARYAFIGTRRGRS